MQILLIYENDVVSTFICNDCRSTIFEFNDFYDRILQVQSVYFKNPTFLKGHSKSRTNNVVLGGGVVEESKDALTIDNHQQSTIIATAIDYVSEVERRYPPQHVECKLECDDSDNDDDVHNDDDDVDGCKLNK